MSQRRNFKRGRASYQRRPPRLQPSGKTFLIVTEGEKTEANYLNALRNRLRLSAVDVEIVHPEGTDPVTLVWAAIRLRDKRSARARKGLEVKYDEVWMVFDLEQTHDVRRQLADEAMALPEAATLKFARSDPCFEYWLLNHVEDTVAAFKDCAAVIRRLKKHWPDYAKDRDLPAGFLEQMPQAVARARLRRKNTADLGGWQHPFTDVDELVSALNAATRPNLQYPLPAAVRS